jgi:hypothetical protein
MARSCRRLAPLLLTAALAALPGACAAPKPVGPLLMHPLPPVAEGYALSQGALVFTGPGFTVSARPWDWRLVEEEFRRAGEPCPFGATPEEVSRFLYFRIRLESHAPQALVFNPLRSAVLRTDESPLLPLENSDLFAFADLEQQKAEALGKAFRRTCFSGTTTLHAGGAVERYLVFRAPEEAKLLTLELDDLWLGPVSFTLRYVFEAYPGK